MYKEAFFCSCGANEHFFTLSRFYDNEDDDYVYLSVYLHHVKFFSRLIRALKYVFGYKSKYGEFTEICLDKNTQIRVCRLLESKDVPS